MKRRSLESGNKLGIMISDDDILVDDIEDIEDDATQLFEHFRIDADKGQEPMRVDKFLFEHLQHSSRNRIQKAADAGFIHVNGKPVQSNYKVKPGDVNGVTARSFYSLCGCVDMTVKIAYVFATIEVISPKRTVLQPYVLHGDILAV